MSRLTLFFLRIYLIGTMILVSSCREVINQSVNSEYLSEVITLIDERVDLNEREKFYVIDQLKKDVEQDRLEKKISFENRINQLLSNFRVYGQEVQAARKTNQTLDKIVKLSHAESLSISKDKGFIIMKLALNNPFPGKIQSIYLEYRYEDDYGNSYFTEQSELSHQTAEDFNTTVEVIMTDIFKNQNEFIYLKSKQSAIRILQENYGLGKEQKAKSKKYLLEGLKVRVVAVKFQSGEIIKRKIIDWDY